MSLCWEFRLSPSLRQALLRHNPLRPIGGIADCREAPFVLHLQRALAPEVGACHLRLAKLEAVLWPDGDEVRFAGHRIADRLDLSADHVRHHESAAPRVEIPF